MLKDVRKNPRFCTTFNINWDYEFIAIHHFYIMSEYVRRKM